MVTERTISLQLKAMEDDGLILHTVHTAKLPLKVDYEMTEFGKDFNSITEKYCTMG